MSLEQQAQEPLPYEGDNNLNLAIQTALGKNDTKALRILFQAQRARNGRKRAHPRLSEEEDGRLREALVAVGMAVPSVSKGRKRKRQELDEESKEEAVLAEEKHDSDDDDNEGMHTNLVDACKAMLRRSDVGTAGAADPPLGGVSDGGSSVSRRGDDTSVAPQLLRTLSNDSLHQYTQALGLPGANQRRTFQALRSISSLQYTDILSAQSAALLKTSVGKGELDHVETVMNLFSNGAKAELGDDAMTIDESDTLAAEFKCPITQDLFYEPATLTCGHTFERAGLLDHLKACQRSGTTSVCPTCRASITKEEHKKLGVNKVLQGLLRRFYSTQMEAVAEREVEKAADGSAASAERLVEITERYPDNPSIFRRAITAFEDWSKEPGNARLLATDKVLSALLRVLRDPLRLTFAREKCGFDLAPFLVKLLAFITSETKGCRLVVKAGFLADCVSLLKEDPLTTDTLVLSRNLLAVDSFSALLRKAKRDLTQVIPTADALTSLAGTLFEATERPSVRGDPELSIHVLKALSQLIRLAADHSPMPLRLNVPMVVKAITAVWDANGSHADVCVTALQLLRALLGLATPLGLNTSPSVASYLASQPLVDKSLGIVKTSRARSSSAGASGEEGEGDVPGTTAEAVMLLMTLAFDEKGSSRDRRLMARAKAEGVFDLAKQMIALESGDVLRVLGPRNKTVEDFRFQKASDPSRVKISADGRTLDITGAGWAVGPPIDKCPTSFVFELGKSCGNRDAVWWGLVVVEKSAEEAEAAGGEGVGPAIPRDATANTPNSPFVVRREGALYAQGRSDRYLYLTGLRDSKVTVKVDVEKRNASFGSARVGWQLLEGKVVRPAVCVMPPPGARPKAKYKVSIRDFTSGYFLGPQAVRMRSTDTNSLEYTGRGMVLLRSVEHAPAKAEDGSSRRFRYAFGPGATSSDDTVLWRFKTSRKSGCAIIGVVGVIPSIPTMPRATARHVPDVHHAGAPTVAFVLAVMSTGEIILRGPDLKESTSKTQRIFGSLARRQVRVTWGSRGQLKVLTNACGEDDGEQLWDSKTLLKTYLNRSDLIVHPFAALERSGEWVALRALIPGMFKPGGRAWLSQCIETASAPMSGRRARELYTQDMASSLAQTGIWENQGYVDALTQAVTSVNAEELVPIPKRSKAMVQMFGYDLNTLKELTKSRPATRIQRCNVIALPETVNEQCRVNRVYVAGLAERCFLVGLKWYMDQDFYKIEALVELTLPDAMKAPQTDRDHQVFEIELQDNFVVNVGLNLGLAFVGGNGWFVRGYSNHRIVRQDLVVMGMSDDVARDMVVGKELLMEEHAEEHLLAFGFDTHDGLPEATCTLVDITEGSYRAGAWEMPDSSDDEGRLRSNHRYRRLRYDVYLRQDSPGTHPLSGGLGMDDEDEFEEEDDDDEMRLSDYM